MPLVFFLLSHLGQTGYYIVTALPVCDNRQPAQGLRRLAQRQDLDGLVLRLQLHLVFNTDNEIVAKLTPAMSIDTAPVPRRWTRDLTGGAVRATRAISARSWRKTCCVRGLTLFSRVRGA